MSVAWPISMNPLHYEGFLQRLETSQNFSILNIHFKYCVRWHFCTLHIIKYGIIKYGRTSLSMVVLNSRDW